MKLLQVAFTAVLWLMPLLVAEGRALKGQVLLVGQYDEKTPAVNVEVILMETGDSDSTKANGLFRLFLPDKFKSGEQMTLLVTKKDWRIQYPLDGEFHIPEHLDKEIVKVWLLPLGSKKFWTENRIEKFIRDTAEKARQQVRPEGKPEEIDFARYIKEWATQYGFSAQQAKAEIDNWIAEVQKKQNDPYKLGLAAYAEKHFGKAGELFTLSAEAKVKRLEELSQKQENLTEEIIRDFRLAGDAEYNNYAFTKALTAYQRALSHVAKEKNKRPLLWSALVSEVASAHQQIGTRTKGPAVHTHLAEAVSAYRNALQVYTRKQLA